MAQPIFITGTDTDAGKTLVTAALLHKLARAGKTTCAIKPVAAGCELVMGQWHNSDALTLQAAASEPLAYSQVNPIALPEACAPHIAAVHEGRHLQVSALEGFCRSVLQSRADIGLIEGAGGWRVPLNERENLSDLAKKLQTPVVLVVGMRLGCLNHALLTAEAIVADGLPLIGWVANCVDEGMMHYEENYQTLAQRLPAPCLGRVPRISRALVASSTVKTHELELAKAKEASHYLDVMPLLNPRV